MDIGRWIDRHAGFTPDKIALRTAREEISYADLAGRIDRAARAMVGELGLVRGDRIAYLGLNSAEQIVLTFAAARAGLSIVPLNWRLAGPEHAFILKDSEAKVLFVEQSFCDHVQGPIPNMRMVGADFSAGDIASLADLMAVGGDGALTSEGGPKEPLLLCYTSGTTGRPKGAVLTQDAILCNALNAQHMHDMTAGDHVLTVLPMFHVGGLNIQTTPVLHCGGTVTLHNRFDPASTLRDIAALRPTLTVQVPATMEAMIRHPDWQSTDLSSLRVVATGSTDVPTNLIEAFHARDLPVIQIYGSTETAPVAVYQRSDDARSRFGSIGRAGLHTEIRLVDADGQDVADGDAGEILVRGKHVATGYWNDPEQTAKAFQDGWFHSGDIAHRDEDGWLWFRDRVKNVIISGGENIYPAEIERVLREVPGIVEVAVVGRPDERWGAAPIAVVACDDPTMTPDCVAAAFEGRLARYKHPKDVFIVEALPRNAMGKVKLDTVRELVGALGPAAS